MAAYYNENDPFAAAWLRELIKADLIGPGEVDERSIEDVRPNDLKGFTQCHFFAGIGGWSYALRLAGWPDDRPVWTGSCPCPSFSAAGKGEGFEDPRHLWPCWFGLIRESRPSTIFGEQADKAIGFGWLDLVQTDMEATDYAFGATVLGAHSVGAPHRRQRLYFVADSADSRHDHAGKHGSGRTLLPARLEQRSRANDSADPSGRRCEQRNEGNRCIPKPDSFGATLVGSDSERNGRWADFAGREAQGRAVDGRDRKTRNGSDTQHDGHDRPRRIEAVTDSNQPRVGLSDGNSSPCERPDADGRNPNTERLQRSGKHGLRAEDGCSPRPERDNERPEVGDLCDATQRGLGIHGSASWSGGYPSQSDEISIGINSEQPRLEGHFGNVREWRGLGWLDPITARSVAEAGATRGFWADCDWWYGRDEKYRPIGAGLFPLVTGATARVGRLRGYGNAITVQTAQAFIESYLEALK